MALTGFITELDYENLKIIFDNAVEGIIVLQGDRVVEINRRGVEICGYSRDEVLAKPFMFFVHPNDRLLVEANYKKRLKGVKVGSYDFRLLNKKGGYSWVRINASRISWFGARAVLVFVNDITQLKANETELHKSGELFNTISGNSVDAIFAKDSDSRYTFVNSGMERITGLNKRELIGKSPDEVYNRELAGLVNKFDRLCFNGKTVNEIAKSVIGNRTFFLHVIQSPMYSSNHAVTGVAGIVRDVTDLVMVNESLKISELRYHNLFRRSKDLIQSVDSDGRFVEVNDEWCRVLGYSHKEASGINLKDVIYPDDLAHCMELFKSVTKGKSVSDVNARFVTKSDGVIYVSGSSYPLFIDGKFSATWGVFRDVTKSIVMLKELEKEREWSNRLVSSAPNMVVGLGVKSRIVLFNESAERITGYKASEVIGKRFIDVFIPKGKREELYKVWHEIVSKRLMEHKNTNPIVTKDGRVLLISWGNSVLTDNGDFKIVLSVGEDVTERENLLSRLSESESNYRSIFDSANDIIIAIDSKGVISNVNNRLIELTGYSPSDLIGKKFFSLIKMIPRESISVLISNFIRRLKGESVSPYEVWMIKKDGSRILFEVNAKALLKNGVITGDLAVLRDVTYRERVRSLEFEKKFNEEFELLRLSFMNNVTHQLRQPLVPIMGYADLLSDNLSGELKVYADKIISNASDLNSLVNIVIRILSINTGASKFKMSACKLGSVIRSIVRDYSPKARLKGLRCLSSIKSKSSVMVNRDSIREAISHLVDNAIKFTNKGFISVCLSESGNKVVISVKDSGIGMKPGEINFKEHGGVGLGLLLVDSIVHLHKGTLTINSSPGKGTEVIIKLPK